MNILVIDDNPLVLRSCERILSGENYKVVALASAEEAIELLRREDSPGSREFHAIITDIMMPEYDGFQLIGDLKKLHHEIPVLAVSGYSTNDTATESLVAGATAFLGKPFTPEELISALERTLAGS